MSVLEISLPNGEKKEFLKPVSVLKVAESISTQLAKIALAGMVNKKLVDLDYKITTDADIKIITSNDHEGLEILRHSCAHLLAQAVQRLFPAAQVTIGPVIDNGFYYDFAYDSSFSTEDINLIEAEMTKIIKENLVVKRHEMSRAAAIKLFKDKKEHYKVEIIKEIPADQTLSFYEQGEFIDLCRGPHIPNTGKIKAFKITKLAGAYWRGNSSNKMLQRIYGTAFADKKSLNKYLNFIVEAEKRDHRKLVKKYDLCHFQDIAPGMVFWHEKGWIIYQIIEDYLRKILIKHGYKEVKTPQVVDLSLWKSSGHWDKFQENMFAFDIEKKTYAVKPMNCPGHVQIYNKGLKSYRDLPLRIAEFGSCHRYEPSGSLHGLMRVRNFVQDDAHIFCTDEQLHSETSNFIDLLFQVYNDFGFEDILIKLSTRPEKRLGDDEIWDKAEQALSSALHDKNLNFEVLPGEGAFYGPKIEFSLKDCIGRVWQCGTIQLDFFMPERLGAEYIAEDGTRRSPIMLHRAIIGTFERFIGIMIENLAGSFPVWLAPVQVMVINITEHQSEYATQITDKLLANEIRAVKDLRNEKIGFKIREHTIQRVPYLVIVGDEEVTQQTLSVRTREGANLGAMTIEDLIAKIKININYLARKQKY